MPGRLWSALLRSSASRPGMRAAGVQTLCAWAAGATLLLGPAAALAQPDAAVFYPVERFELQYQGSTEGLPELEDFLKTRVTVGVSPAGFVSPVDAAQKITFSLQAVPEGPPPRFDAGALVAINEQVVAQFNRAGLVGVLVAPDPADIDSQNGRDLRGGDPVLTLMVAVARVRGVRTKTVKEVKTFAVGDRIEEEEGVNNPAHEWIREESPIGPNDPLREPPLEEFSSWLSRHPGRRVDTVVSPSRDPGWVYLDYQVTESKPWFAYFNYSNTGTKSTTIHRERFGFAHNQVSGHDDIFRVEYVTGNFIDVHGVFSSYEAPIPFTGRRLRGEVDFSWTTFDASQFGSQFFDASFEGEQWEVGARLAYPIFQWGPLFVDAFAGFRYAHYELDQIVEGTLVAPGDTDLFYPSVGFRLERNTPTSLLDGRFSFDWSAPELSDTAEQGGGEDGLDNLGRVGSERNVEIFRWDLSYSVFLEPLLFPDKWSDPTSPFNSTLAHELFFWVRGQATADDRLVPQEEAVAGGLYSVRGYDQSLLAGDGLFNFTFEYRLHVPRLFRPAAAPVKMPVLGDFSIVPRREFGFPDWDFIIRAFFDSASTTITNPQSSAEFGQLMQSVGLGFEVRLKQYVNFRFDWGVGMRTVDLGNGEEINGGLHEFHISSTFLF